jgi:Zn-dependent M32 family carboxypeptidase
MQVGLSEPFAQWLLPLVAKHFPDFPQRSAQDFYAAENVIKSPSLIRVEADEVRHHKI